MSGKRLFPVLLAAALAAPCFGQSAAVQKAFQRGAMAMHNGDYTGAESAFREAVHLDPTLAEAHLDLGLVLAHDGRLADGTASIRRALQINPRLPGGHMFLGIFLFQANQVDEARKALQDELRLSPTNAEAMMWLGNVELAANRPAQAAAQLDRALELQPKDMNLLELSGRAHSEAARESYSRMARLDPGSWHVHRVQAQLFSTEGRHTDAIKELQAAIEQEKQNPDLYEMLGDEYRATSQLEAAEGAYQQEQQLAPANPIALYNLGSTQVERGEAERGVRLLERANQLYPGAPTVEYYFGRGLAQLDRNEEAAAVLAQAAENDKDGEVGKRSLFELARVDRKLHRTAEAQVATDRYNQLRLKQEQTSNEQIGEWRKLEAPAAPSSAADHTGH